jgi:hypothetical protein
VFGKIRAWSQRHPKLVDSLWLAPLVGLCVMTAISYTGRAPIGLGGYLALSAALLVPLFWRGSHPRVVFAIVSLISFFQWLAAVDAFPANAAVLVATV